LRPIPVKFALQANTNMRLEIYDVAGRRVRRLTEGVFPAGTYTSTWDGRTDGGSRVVRGIYLVRLWSDAGVVVRRVAYLGP